MLFNKYTLKDTFNTIKIEANNHKGSILIGAAAGIMAGLLLPTYKKVVIEDDGYVEEIALEEAIKLVDSITAATNFYADEYLKGKISAPEFEAKVNEYIVSASGGRINNRSELQQFVNHYNEKLQMREGI